MGRYAGQRGFNSAPGVFCVICRTPRARYLSVFAMLIPLIIYMYYVVIEAWCLGYAYHYLTGSLMKGDDADALKGDVLALICERCRRILVLRPGR